MPTSANKIILQETPISAEKELAALETDGETGAVAAFVGVVRGGAVAKMTVEHYPAMTEKQLHDIAAAARRHWHLTAVRVAHRFGTMRPGEVIVFVGTAAAHRAAAFAACQYITDYLKSRAPFWKKESTAAGENWVSANAADEAALRQWEKSTAADEQNERDDG